MKEKSNWIHIHYVDINKLWYLESCKSIKIDSSLGGYLFQAVFNYLRLHNQNF